MAQSWFAAAECSLLIGFIGLLLLLGNTIAALCGALLACVCVAVLLFVEVGNKLCWYANPLQGEMVVVR